VSLYDKVFWHLMTFGIGWSVGTLANDWGDRRRARRFLDKTHNLRDWP